MSATVLDLRLEELGYRGMPLVGLAWIALDSDDSFEVVNPVVAEKKS